MASRRDLWVACVALACVAAGCGGGGGTTASSTAAETAQKPAKLLPGWHRRVDTDFGYTVGVPPGWRAQERTGATLLQPPDHLIAVTISADRTGDAVEGPVDEFATAAIAALPGYRQSLTGSKPRAFHGTPFDAVQTHAGGTLVHTGVPERVALFVLRRDTE